MLLKSTNKSKRLKKKSASPLYLGNASKDFPVDNMKRTGLYWYNYDFLFDYDNEPCIARPTFVDLNPVELNYYLFIIVMLLMIYQLRSLFSVKQKCMKNVKIKC